MKKALRYLFIVIGILLLIAGGFAAVVALRGVPDYKAEHVDLKVSITPERVERGRQLSAMICYDCHLNRNTNKLTGKRMDEIKQFGVIYSKNITRDPEHGIGKWTDGELLYLLRTGIKPDGRFLPVMAKLQKMSDEDIATAWEKEQRGNSFFPLCSLLNAGILLPVDATVKLRPLIPFEFPAFRPCFLLR